MKKLSKKSKIAAGIVVGSMVFGLSGLTAAFAATTPSLGTAATFGVLSDTFTNPIGPTIVTGDVGYTTPPVVAAIVIGSIYTAVSGIPAGAVYTQAGTDQATALNALNSGTNTACDFTFAPGAIDLAADTTHIPAHGSVLGEYFPGVYCTAGVASALSVGTAGITLSGAGTYIFRNDGALNTVTGSSVTLNGASACDVFWTPNGATTLNHDSTFAGTVIPVLAAAHDITIYSGVAWIGRALTFGHTVTTPGADVAITVPVCASIPPTPPEGKTGTNYFGQLPSINITKIPRPLNLPSWPRPVTYTYAVTNTGKVPMNTVWVKDDKCSPVQYVSGDTNGDGLLDLTETWAYDCFKSVSQTETNTATAHGWGVGLGMDVYATAVATVTVSASVVTVFAPAVVETSPIGQVLGTSTPSFPDTGLPPRETDIIWGLIALSVIILTPLLFYFGRGMRNA